MVLCCGEQELEGRVCVEICTDGTLLQVNVPYSETTSHRAEVVSLVYPHNTEMDLSIAYALYFAARGTGLSYSHPSSTAVPYATSARVLLSGLGADELFGGYGRHAVGFSRDGYRALLEEIKLDVGRLGKRNLGRDDRAMAHWGREVRFPFLDEDLVLWAIQLPVWEKCDFENAEAGGPFIEPGKRVLRLVAEELGMSGVAREKKRAVSHSLCSLVPSCLLTALCSCRFNLARVLPRWKAGVSRERMLYHEFTT